MTENVWNSWMYEEDIKIKSTNPKWRKLVDYYNQMREERFWEKWYFKYTNRFDNVHIISKNMWFIKWLIDHDKINTDYWPWYWLHPEINIENWERVIYSTYESLLIKLALSDNPISLLLSFLI